MTKGAQKYLSEVWGYDSIKLMDPLTASAILENHRENNPQWVHDAELWNAYAELHNIPKDISFDEFIRKYRIVGIDFKK